MNSSGYQNSRFVEVLFVTETRKIGLVWSKGNDNCR